MSDYAERIIRENIEKHRRGEDASYLDLGRCGLTEMPDLSGMDWLKGLLLSDAYQDLGKEINSKNHGKPNKIEKLDSELFPKHLNIFILEGNAYNSNIRLNNFNFIENWTDITELRLGFNNISDGRFLEKLTGLTTLDLSSNNISDGRFLEKLTGLTTLDLRSNNISDWRFLEKLTGLTTLDLRFNNISDGRFLEKLTGLTTLDLSSNNISDGRFLEKLTGLTKIDVSSNQLKDLTPFLYFIREKRMEVVSKKWYETKNSEINVKDNPLTHPPLEIVAQGTEAILRYFEELETTKAKDIRPLNEAKLIVIGQPRAGKTTLRYKLCDTEREMPKQEDSTRGIDIELQSFTYTDEAGIAQNFQYHIWDFGGQQIYHATHRFFLTKRTVYVAVVDTDVNDKQNDLDYWLHMIELMGDGSPILLVQNQKNDRSIDISDALRNRFRTILAAKDYELNLNRLKKQNNPKFDAKRLKDFQHFQKDIERIFEQQSPILMTRPKSDTRQALEHLSKEKPVIEMSEYQRVCVDNALVDPLAQTDLLRTLHNLGICFWYEDYDFLDRIVILQNRWATDAVFKVLDNETVKKDKGHFKRKQLNQIWAANEYKKRVSELVELMKRFKLCYQIGATDEYIVPQLLDKNPPDGFSRETIKKGSVRMVIEYEFMPRGIMTQFIVAMHRQISGGQRHAWETGFAVQSINSVYAVGLAEESYDNRKLELWAQGIGAGILLQQMLDELEKIHESFNRLRYNKLIPCLCIRCGAPGATRIKEFDYEEILLEMYQNRQTGIRCSYGNQIVPFEQLLGVLGFTSQQTEHDYRKTEQKNDTHFNINLNLPNMEDNGKKGDTYHINVQGDNNGNLAGKQGNIQQEVNQGTSPNETTTSLPQNGQKMKNYLIVGVIGILLIGAYAVYKVLKDGGKATVSPTSVSVEKNTQKTDTLTTATTANVFSLQVPIKINGETPSPEQIGFMSPNHKPSEQIEMATGGLFLFRNLEIPKDKILIFELFSKEGKSLAKAQTSFVEANKDGLSVLNTLQFTGKLDKKRNQYINITVAPQFKVQISNTQGNGNNTSQQQ